MSKIEGRQNTPPSPPFDHLDFFFSLPSESSQGTKREMGQQIMHIH